MIITMRVEVRCLSCGVESPCTSVGFGVAKDGTFYRVGADSCFPHKRYCEGTQFLVLKTRDEHALEPLKLPIADERTEALRELTRLSQEMGLYT